MNDVPVEVNVDVAFDTKGTAYPTAIYWHDGRTHNIPDLYDGVIEITPIPTVEELNAHVWGEEFHACIIEQAEFEAIWESRFYSGAF